MRKTLKVVAFGGGPADAFIKAAGITDSTQQTAIKTLVNDLNGYGLWSKMKAIYPMVGGTATSHSYNLKDTTKFQITWNGGLTHDSNGVTGNGTNGYGNTSLNPNSFSSLHYSYYSRTTNTSGREIGIETGGGAWDIIISLGGTIYGRFGSSSSISSTNSDSKGFYLNTEASTLSHKLFKNNTQLGSISFSGAGYPNYNVFISAINILGSAGNFGSRQCAFSSIGDGLTDTEASNLYTAIQKFQTTLSRQI
jgi:hypothetical protein